MSSRGGSATDRSNDVSSEPAKPRRRSSLKQSSEPASPGSTGSRRPSFRRSSISVEPEEDKLARLERERIAAEEAVAEAAREEDVKALAIAEHEKERDTAVAKAMDLGILETPLEAARITLRMYTHRQSVFRAHSFLVGNESGGLSEQLGRIPIQAKRTTLEMLRSLIETTVDNKMVENSYTLSRLHFVHIFTYVFCIGFIFYCACFRCEETRSTKSSW